ncbi:MAG: DUF2796 domain-containing protein [Pseudomonadota bacterium]
MTPRYSLNITAFVALALLASCAPANETESAAANSEAGEAVAPINESSQETEVEELSVEDVASTEAEEVETVAAEPEEAHAHDDHDHDHDEDHAHEGEHDHEDEHAHEDGHDDHDHDHDHAGGEAHVHGESDLLIAIEGENVSVSFESPLANLIGFEHEPKTDAESEAYNAMRDSLAESDTVLSFSEAADCTHYSSETSIRRSGDHATLIADYEFTCSDVDALTDGTVLAFAAFAGIESMDVVVVSETTQTETTLSAGSVDFAIDQ